MDIDCHEEGSPVKGILVGVLASLAFVACWILVATQAGCTTDGKFPPGAIEFVTNVAQRIEATIEERKNESPDKGADEAAAPQTTKPSVSTASSAPESGSLVFRYGGFDGSRAVEDPNTQIADLHMTRSKLTYKWAKGSLKNWGLADTDAGAIACCFFWDGKQWIGAKTDWISTSRTSRDFNNLNGGYNGWKPELYWAAPKRAFCIVSRDGKKRTNLLETTEP